MNIDLNKYVGIPFDDAFIKKNFTLKKDDSYVGTKERYIAKPNYTYGNIELFKDKKTWTVKVMGEHVLLNSAIKFINIYNMLNRYVYSDSFKIPTETDA